MKTYRALKMLIATVWLANGAVKLFHLVPRHEQIVARILGDAYAAPLTRMIGMAEIGLSVAYLVGYRERLNLAMQIALVAIMNAIEFILAPDLLLWGWFNAVFAFLFILVLFYQRAQTPRPIPTA